MIGLLFIPLILFFLLLCLAFLNLFGLSLDKVIKLSDLAGLAATTLVAVVLQYIVQRRGKATDAEKHLLTAQASTLLSDLLELKAVLLPLVAKTLVSEDVTKIVQGFDSLGEELSTFKFCIENSHCSTLIVDYKWIERGFIEYKVAITGGNFPAESISFSASANGSMHRSKMDKDLRLLIFKIAKK